MARWTLERQDEAAERLKALVREKMLRTEGPAKAAFMYHGRIDLQDAIAEIARLRAGLQGARFELDHYQKAKAEVHWHYDDAVAHNARINELLGEPPC